MNFRPELAEAVIAGRKTVTRRVVSDNPRSPWSDDRAPQLVGKRVAICPGRGKHQIGSARVLSVIRENFNPSKITDEEARHEGFRDRNAFLHTWHELHPKSVVLPVWRIALGYVEAAS